jgi:hypothetical protein
VKAKLTKPLHGGGRSGKKTRIGLALTWPASPRSLIGYALLGMRQMVIFEERRFAQLSVLRKPSNPIIYIRY